jgi:hypothetical protein
MCILISNIPFHIRINRQGAQWPMRETMPDKLAPNKTTINIHRTILKKLNAIATRKGITKRDVIVMILRRVMLDHRDLIRSFTITQYQKRDPEKQWEKMHVDFNGVEYEQNLDLKKAIKWSLSRIIAYAITHYFETILNEPRNIGLKDSYPFQNYIFTKSLVGNIIKWAFYCGIPEPIPEEIPINNIPSQ